MEKAVSDPSQAHRLDPNVPDSIGLDDVVFDCPACHKSLVVDKVAVGHALACPSCGAEVKVPEPHRVVTLAEAPETKSMEARPAWERDLIALESAIKETGHQRQEAGNFYKHHMSEASRQQLRIERLDARLKELTTKRDALRVQHPP